MEENGYNEENFGSFAARKNPRQNEMDDYRRDLDEDEEPIELFEVNILNAADETESQARRNQPENPFGAPSVQLNDGINADEFEHIAEIYDQIRLLH
jgi:hypothetical protein